MHTELIVALDVDDIEKARSLVNELSGTTKYYKIGMRLFTKYGPSIVEEIAKKGCRVFLDLKFMDIPSVVASTVESAASMGAYAVSLHISGGSEMLIAAQEVKQRPKLWGVTILTSISQNLLNETGITNSIESRVELLASLGIKCGLDGIVCSPREISLVRKCIGPAQDIVTPGIRLASAAVTHDDQVRTLTPKEASDAGATYIVVGRPIIEASDPKQEVENIRGQLRK